MRELQGPSAAAAVLPPDPRWERAENTLIRWPELWLILAGAMARTIQQFRGLEASGGHLRGWAATSALTTGGIGGAVSCGCG
jgi:hypothetical protein